MGVIHECRPIPMGTPIPRMVCGECGHDENCTIHGGSVQCRSWRTSCEPDRPDLKVVD